MAPRDGPAMCRPLRSNQTRLRGDLDSEGWAGSLSTSEGFAEKGDLGWSKTGSIFRCIHSQKKKKKNGDQTLTSGPVRAHAQRTARGGVRGTEEPVGHPKVPVDFCPLRKGEVKSAGWQHPLPMLSVHPHACVHRHCCSNLWSDLSADSAPCRQPHAQPWCAALHHPPSPRVQIHLTPRVLNHRAPYYPASREPGPLRCHWISSGADAQVQENDARVGPVPGKAGPKGPHLQGLGLVQCPTAFLPPRPGQWCGDTQAAQAPPGHSPSPLPPPMQEPRTRDNRIVPFIVTHPLPPRSVGEQPCPACHRDHAGRRYGSMFLPGHPESRSRGLGPENR